MPVRTIATPLGVMIAAATPAGVCLCDFSDRKHIDKLCQKVYAAVGEQLLPADAPMLAQLEEELHEYYSGVRHSFSVPVAAVGTDFQQRVWHALRGIAYGSTTSYLQLSEQLGDRLAIRAVANANGNNCVALLLPCHRVIGTDGSLTGYGGGLERKKLLLELEARHSQQHYQPSLF